MLWRHDVTRADPAQSSTKNGSADAQCRDCFSKLGDAGTLRLSHACEESTLVAPTDSAAGAGKWSEF